MTSLGKYGLAIALLGAVACNSQPIPQEHGPDGGTTPPDGPGPGAPDAEPEIDAIPPDAVVPTVPPEVDGRLVINEVMASNALTALDPNQIATDWIEIYNPGDVDVDLHGYGLTIDLTDPNQTLIADGVVVPAGGRVVLWKVLPKDGGDIGLARPDGTWIDRVHYGEQETDFSAAREPDGSDLWQIEWHASPGEANPAGAGQPVGFEVDSAPPEQIPAAGDLSARIYDLDNVLPLTLLITPADAASLEASPLVMVHAQLVYDGRTYGPIGVKLKGQNSFEPFSQKPSLRLHIDGYNPDARFFGLKDMTLNNMHSDASMMHERISYEVARAAGIPASRASYAMLTINDQLYGLYANVETVKKKMLARWYPDATGSLFEATDVDFTASYVPQYALENGPEDRTLLYGLANALTLPVTGDALAAAASFVDLAEFRRFWAMCSIVGQFDSFPYSVPGDDYFVYADPTAGKLQFLPWGMDETYFSADFPVTQTYSVLAGRCKDSPSCFQDYVNQTWAILADTEAANLIGEAQRIANQIAPYTVLDTRKHYTDADVTTAQAAVRWYIGNRRVRLGGMIPPPT